MDESAWAPGYGTITHREDTRARIRVLAARLATQRVRGDGIDLYALLHAADRVASAAMWLVAHETYARRVYTDGRALRASDFKPRPEGHMGGTLNMVPAYVGYLVANAITGQTRSWLMGQGHCVGAIDGVNLLVGNTSPAHAARYGLDDEGLTRYVNDFYSFRMRADGGQESPRGSHVNAHTAGGISEGGYLGFAELQYVHMPLPGERLVVFLSDGAFEEQRGSDWAPRWWRARDSGLVTPFMIANGRRIDQRTTMSQQGGLQWFEEHLRLNGFDPMGIDGRDPAAFAWAILEMEERLQAAGAAAEEGSGRYPVKLPYTIAVAPKGAGFYGEGTNLAHNLPLPANPAIDVNAATFFNQSAARLYVPPPELAAAVERLQGHTASGRPRERDHALATREVALPEVPAPTFRPVNRGAPGLTSAMAAVDAGFAEICAANPQLRPRVGNPDEMRSNRMLRTLERLSFRVTDPEPGIPEKLEGAVVTALNEEAIAAAAVANRGGLNIVVTYEAFAPKMFGLFRQEITFARQLAEAGRPTGWISVPLVLTSHTWENAKNEHSHQDPSMAEAMLGESSEVSRVVFPADHNSAAAVIEALYRTRGQFWTLVVPKAEVPDLFTPEEARQLVQDGALPLAWAGHQPEKARLSLTAVGAYQLTEVLRASARLTEKGIAHTVLYMLEPGRFRQPRNAAEETHLAPEDVRRRLYPAAAQQRIFVTHTRPEALLGTLQPLNTGAQNTVGLGFLSEGGTLSTRGLMFANRSSWAHVVQAAARLLERPRAELLTPAELAALDGTGARGPLEVLY